MSYSASTEPIAVAAERKQSSKGFLVTLFNSLDANQVRYCVLHSWEGLPDEPYSDLDIAVDPTDEQKLVSAFSTLRREGYIPVQVINYFIDAYCFRFGWIEGSKINLSALDVIFKHQMGALVKPSVKSLVAGRRRHNIFWVPAPESEFSYLLAKKSWKGAATRSQCHRLKLLSEQLGRPAAERLAADLFWGSFNLRIVEACSAGDPNTLLAKGKAVAWKTSIVRNPSRLIADLLLNAMRRVRRWSQPTGLFIAVLGPDGTGKSTLVKNLLEAIEPCFQHHTVFHWRPMIMFRRKNTSDVARPHSLSPHGRWRSVARVFAHLLDYWLGYWFLIRPLLARTGLVVFDRYFDDLAIDPRRYRYGGPLWFARMIGRLIPKPDLVLVLDAPEEVALSRKQEIAPQELQRLRQLYSEYAKCRSNCRSINASGPMLDVTEQSARVIFDFMTSRVECRHARWLHSIQT